MESSSCLCNKLSVNRRHEFSSDSKCGVYVEASFMASKESPTKMMCIRSRLLHVCETCATRAQLDSNMTTIGLYRENAIAIENEARDPFGGNVYYVTMQIAFPIPEFARKKRNLHCDVVHVTTKWVSRLVLDHTIAAIQTSR